MSLLGSASSPAGAGLRCVWGAWAGWRWSRLLVGTALLCVAGCYRSVEVQPGELHQLSDVPRLESQPGNAKLARRLDGELVRIDDFDSVVIRYQGECTETPVWDGVHEGPTDNIVDCRREKDTFRRPLRVYVEGDSVSVGDDQQVRHYLLEEIDHVIVRETAPERGLIVMGVSLTAAIVAGVAASRVDRSCEDAFSCWGLVPVAAGAAGGLSLSILIPLTKPLGEVE